VAASASEWICWRKARLHASQPAESCKIGRHERRRATRSVCGGRATRLESGPTAPATAATVLRAAARRRMRPCTLAEMVGQEHVLRPGAPAAPGGDQPFRQPHLLWPAGSGKTSLAEAIARETKSRFVRVNAVMSNVAELRDILAVAAPSRGRTILFIDELHRFNKSQQDLLLPDVEAATCGSSVQRLTIGILRQSALLSRSHLSASIRSRPPMS